MQALPYQGSKNVRVKGVPDPVLVANDEILLRQIGQGMQAHTSAA